MKAIPDIRETDATGRIFNSCHREGKKSGNFIKLRREGDFAFRSDLLLSGVKFFHEGTLPVS